MRNHALTTCSLTLIVAIACANARSSAQDLVGDNLFLSDFFPRIELFDESTMAEATIWGVEGGLEIDTVTDINAVTIDAFTLRHTLSTSFSGVGVGTRFATAPLHVFSSGDELDPFVEARVLIDNAHPFTTPRNMLHLRNNGAARVVLENTSSQVRWLMLTQNDNFQVRVQGPQQPSMQLRPTGLFAINSGTLNTMVVRPNGDVIIAGTLFQSSDRDRKTNYRPVDAGEVLQKVVDLPITTWNYKSGPEAIRHMGPTAQDFRQAFELGSDERTIATVDASGVALAAIQGLYGEIQQRDRQIEQLREQNAEMQQQLRDLADDLETRLQQLESMLEK